MLPEYNDNLQLSLRNVPYLESSLLADVNTYDIVNAQMLVLPKPLQRCLWRKKWLKIVCKFITNFQIRKMKLTEVLIRPILTEKANAQQEKLRRYAFKVNKKANKLEIKKAVEDFYGITVIDVNTVVVPSKARSRSTKAGLISRAQARV